MKQAKRILAVVLVSMLTLGMCAVGASALDQSFCNYCGNCPDCESFGFGAGASTVLGTRWRANFLNWLLFIVLFGWIWMWFIPPLW